MKKERKKQEDKLQSAQQREDSERRKCVRACLALLCACVRACSWTYRGYVRGHTHARWCSCAREHLCVCAPVPVRAECVLCSAALACG